MGNTDFYDWIVLPCTINAKPIRPEIRLKSHYLAKLLTLCRVSALSTITLPRPVIAE
jgi:hypothetical protein